MKSKLLFLVVVLATNYAMAQAIDDRFKLLQTTNGSYPYNTGIIKSQTYGLTNLNNAIVFNDFVFNYGDFNLFSGQGMKISSTGAHSPLTPIIYYTEYLNCALPSCFEGIWSLSSSPNEKFIYYNYFLASYSGNVTVILSYINSASVEHTVFFDLKAAGYDQVVSLSVNDAGTAVALTQTFLPGGERQFDVITLQPSGIITKLTPVAGHVDNSCYLGINNLGTIFLTTRDESSRFLQVFPQNSPARILSSNLYLFGGERIVGTDKTTALHPEGMVYIVKPYDGIYDSENSPIFTSYQYNQRYGKVVVMYEAKINNKQEFIWTGFDYATGKNGLYLGWGQEPIVQAGDEVFHTPVYDIASIHLNDNGVYIFTDYNWGNQTSRLLMGGNFQEEKDYNLKIYALNGSGARYLCLDNSNYCQSGGIKDGETINLPLGAHIELELVDLADDNINIPATYQLIASSLSIPNIQNYPSSFYTDRIAFSFSQEREKQTQKIMPVHLGTQQIKIRPLDTNKKEITLTLIIQPASTIGNYNNEVDELVVKYANQTGIPPQYIKAQIEQESGFDNQAFRYEPAYDLTYIGSKNNVTSSGERIQPKYKNLLFYETKRSPTAQQIHPRSRYKLYPGTAGNEIPDNYEFTFDPYAPTYANEIVYKESNEGVKTAEGLVLVEKQNWYSANVQVDEKLVPRDYIKLSNKLDFIAQTVVASSYGLMQLMYPTAFDLGFSEIEISKKQRIKVGRDPLELFDPNTNLSFGTKNLASTFRIINNYYNFDTNIVDKLENFNEYIQNAYAGYNGGTSLKKLFFEDPDPQFYKLSVLKKSRNCMPLLSINVFNN